MVQKIVQKLIGSSRPDDYTPFYKERKVTKITRESALRTRGFRQAIIEVYDYKCAFCGLKINTPDSISWEVEAAHIVPVRSNGKDDVLNGLALCRLHHWAFDAGWLTLKNDFTVQVSSKIHSLPSEYGRIHSFDFIRDLSSNNTKILLPKSKEIYPHHNAMGWHRENKFYK